MSSVPCFLRISLMNCIGPGRKSATMAITSSMQSEQLGVEFLAYLPDSRKTPIVSPRASNWKSSYRNHSSN